MKEGVRAVSERGVGARAELCSSGRGALRKPECGACAAKILWAGFERERAYFTVKKPLAKRTVTIRRALTCE